MSVPLVADGAFVQTSTEMVATDPSYDFFGTHNNNNNNDNNDANTDESWVPKQGAFFTGVLPGTWFSYYVPTTGGQQGLGKEIGQVFVIHEDFADTMDRLEWETSDPIVVYTGSAGVFDARYYQPNDPELESATLDIENGLQEHATLSYGALGRSPQGNGTYDTHLARDESGNTVGVGIVFIDESLDSDDTNETDSDSNTSDDDDSDDNGNETDDSETYESDTDTDDSNQSENSDGTGDDDSDSSDANDNESNEQDEYQENEFVVVEEEQEEEEEEEPDQNDEEEEDDEEDETTVSVFYRHQ